MTARPPDPLPLDDDGLLSAADFERVATAPAYAVFAQQGDARIDAALWKRHASQFFDVDLALTRPKRYGADAPRTDGAHVSVTRRNGASFLRTVLLRPTTDADLLAAGRAEGGGGLALLAKRCAMVALVQVARDAPDADALFLAAILAGLLLGPVLAPDRARILGPRTAREEAGKLAR